MIGRYAFIGLSVLAQTACLIEQTATWTPTGQVRPEHVVAWRRAARPAAPSNLDVDLDHRTFSIRFTTYDVPWCSHDGAGAETFHGLALAGDLAIGAGLAGAGYWTYRDCGGELCGTATAAAAIAGLLYLAITIWQSDEKRTNVTWRPSRPAPCRGFPSLTSGSRDPVVLRTSRYRTIVPRDGAQFVATIPFDEAAEAVLETRTNTIPISQLFDGQQLPVFGVPARLATEMSFTGYAGEDLLVAGESLAVRVVIRNVGDRVTWVRPLLKAADDGHVAIENPPRAQLLRPGASAEFALTLRAGGLLGNGEMVLQLLIENLAETQVQTQKIRTGALRMNSPKLLFVGTTVLDGQPGAELITRGNRDGAVQRGEQVQIQFWFKNDSPIATDDLELTAETRDPNLVLRRRYPQRVGSLAPGSLGHFDVEVMVAVEYGLDPPVDGPLPIDVTLVSKRYGPLILNQPHQLMLARPPPPIPPPLFMPSPP